MARGRSTTRKRKTTVRRRKSKYTKRQSGKRRMSGYRKKKSSYRRPYRRYGMSRRKGFAPWQEFLYASRIEQARNAANDDYQARQRATYFAAAQNAAQNARKRSRAGWTATDRGYVSNDGLSFAREQLIE